MSRDRAQLRWVFDGEEPDDAPMVYVACALSHLSPTDRKLLDAWCAHISVIAVDSARQAEPPWEVRVHLPIVWSAPWRKDGARPEQVYAMNRRQVLKSAALVILGHEGGSLGAGQELEWAAGTGIPILYLAHDDDPISRQLLGTPANVSVTKFGDTDELADGVRRFMQSHRDAMEDHARRTRDMIIVSRAEHERFRDAWTEVDERERSEIAATSRIHPRRIEELLSDPLMFVTARHSELIALAGALAISPGATVGEGQLPELTDHQEAALAAAADEYTWPAEVLELMQAARVELAAAGIRRLPLTSPDDWVHFRNHRSDA